MIIPKRSKEELLKYLEAEHLKIKPASKIREFISNIDDVYKERALLKVCRWDFESFDYLLSIFQRTLLDKSRFIKKVDCFKVVRQAIRRNFDGCQFPNKILDKLFFLFREFLLLTPPVNYDIVSWLSVALKNQVLNDEQVDWLIHNASVDETIIDKVRFFSHIILGR